MDDESEEDEVSVISDENPPKTNANPFASTAAPTTTTHLSRPTIGMKQPASQAQRTI